MARRPRWLRRNQTMIPSPVYQNGTNVILTQQGRFDHPESKTIVRPPSRSRHSFGVGRGRLVFHTCQGEPAARQVGG